MKKITGAMVIIILLAAGIPVFAQSGPTHIIGQVAYQGYGFNETGNESLNGYVTEGLYMIFKNIEYGDYIVSITKENGIFTENNMPPGLYQIQELVYSIYKDSNPVNTSWRPLFPMFFNAEEGKVNNLGFFWWEAVYDESVNAVSENFLDYNMSYDEVMATFEAYNPASSWNSMEWVEIPVTESGETMLIGMIGHMGSGYESWGEWSLDGTTISNLEITIEEVLTGREILLRTNSMGFFAAVDLPYGYYTIRSFYNRKRIYGDEASVNLFPVENLLFRIEENKINNLGVFLWITEYNDWTEDLDTNAMNYGYSLDDVMDFFFQYFPKSKWSYMDWIETEITASPWY